MEDGAIVALVVCLTFGLPILIFLLRIPCGCIVVGKKTVAIIERCGKFHKVADEGFHYLIPCVDRIRTLRWRFSETHFGASKFFEMNLDRIDLRESSYDFQSTKMITRDNVEITVHPFLLYKITDPVRAVYEIYDVGQALSRLVQTTLRALIGDLGLDDALASRGELNRSLMNKIADVCHNWGIEVTAVEILEIAPATNIQSAMHQQISAERTRRAQVVESQGIREQEKLLAEGSCKAAITLANAHQRVKEVEAHGEAESRKIIARAEAQAISTLDEVLRPVGVSAAEYLIGMKYINATSGLLQRAGRRRAFLPYQSDIVGSARTCFTPMEEGKSIS